MNRYYGTVGYAITEEVALDVWQDVIVERNYVGDVLKNNRRWVGGEHLNDNLVINNSISIVADPYAYNHYTEIKYCTWMNSKWKVTNVQVAYPRLILELGEVYNDQGETE